MKNIRWDILLLSVLFMLPRKQQTSNQLDCTTEIESDCSLDCTTETKSIYFGSPLVNISCLNNTWLENRTILHKYLIKTALCIKRSNPIPSCSTKHGYMPCSTQICSAKKTRCFEKATVKAVGSRIMVNLTRRYQKVDYAIMFLNSKNICVHGIIQDCSKCQQNNEGVLSMIRSCINYNYICSRDIVFVTRHMPPITHYTVLLIGLRPENKSAGLVNIYNVEIKCSFPDLIYVEFFPSYYSILVSWQIRKLVEKVKYCKINQIMVKYNSFDWTDSKEISQIKITANYCFIQDLTKCLFYNVHVCIEGLQPNRAKEIIENIFTGSINLRKIELVIYDAEPDHATLKLKNIKDPYCSNMSIIIEVHNSYTHSSVCHKSNTDIIKNVKLARNILYLFYITFTDKAGKPISPNFFIRKYYSSQKNPMLFTYGPILKDNKLVIFEWAIFRKFQGSIFLYLVQFWSDSICKGAHLMKCTNCPCYTSIYNLLPHMINTIRIMLKCDWVNVSNFNENEVQFNSYIQINKSEGISKRKHYLILYGITPAGYIRMSESNQLTVTYTEGFSLDILATLFIILIFVVSIMILLYFFLKKKRRLIRSEAVQVIQRHKRQSDDDTDTRSNAKPSSSEH